MNSEKSVNWREILHQPQLDTAVSKDEIYRAACIGAVTLLFEAGDCDGLMDAVRHAAAPESRVRSLLALENLTKVPDPTGGKAVHSLYELALLDKNPEAAKFIQKHDLWDQDPGWYAAGLLLFEKKHRLTKEDPGLVNLSELFLQGDEQLRHCLLELGEKNLPNWTLMMRFLDDPSAENSEILLEKFKTFSPEERRLVRLCAGKEKPVSSLPADLLLRYEDEDLLKLCTEKDLRPSDASQEALFYFLSGQWERYYASDSDYRRIRLAYEGKDPELQRRLIAVSRDSGNSAWLRDVGGNAENLPHGGTLADQHLLAASLIEQQQWPRLWNMLPNLPLLCMPPVCDALQNAGFRPDRLEDRSFSMELSAKINACRGLSPVPVHERLGEGLGTAVGICGGGPYAAVLFADRRILVWDTREAFSEPIRIVSSHLNFRKAIISHDGKYLCVDCGKDGITLFSLPGGQAVKTIRLDGNQAAGLFVQKDDRRMIVQLQNGRGTVYSFPGGSELFTYDLGLRDCVRAAYDAEENRICGLTLSGECMVYDLGGRRLLSGLSLSEDVLASSDEYFRNRWPLIEKGDVLTLVNLLSGKEVYHEKLPDAGTVRRVIPLFDGELFAFGCLDGHVRIFDPVMKNYPAVLSLGSKSAVTGLWFDARASVLYGCNAAGTVRSWDLALFREMIRVLPLMQLPGINRIDEFVKKYPEPGVKAAADWLKTVIAWRRRFDIEIEF